LQAHFDFLYFFLNYVVIDFILKRLREREREREPYI